MYAAENSEEGRTSTRTRVEPDASKGENAVKQGRPTMRLSPTATPKNGLYTTMSREMDHKHRCTI